MLMRSEAALMRAKGRLKQLHLAVANYESKHNCPFSMLKNGHGQATINWFVTLLPEFEFNDQIPFDPTKNWNDRDNQAALAAGQNAWNWFCGDGYLPAVLNAEKSVWRNQELEGTKLHDCRPDDILFVATQGRYHHPAEPNTIDTDSIVEALRSGGRAVFVDAEGKLGEIRLAANTLTFVRDE